MDTNKTFEGLAKFDRPTALSRGALWARLCKVLQTQRANPSRARQQAVFRILQVPLLSPIRVNRCAYVRVAAEAEPHSWRCTPFRRPRRGITLYAEEDRYGQGTSSSRHTHLGNPTYAACESQARRPPVIAASQVRVGMAIRYENQPYRVLVADYHPGQGRMGGVNHVRLRNLATGTLWEHSLRADLKIEELAIERRSLEFLYTDGGQCYFMDPHTFDQVEIPTALIGEPARFLEPGMSVPVEFMEGRPVTAVLPGAVDVVIADTAPALHGQQDSNWKPARLANGVEIMVPPFIGRGDSVRLNLAELKYMDRAKTRSA